MNPVLDGNHNKIRAIQGILGVDQDGIFGPKSQQALTDLINLSNTHSGSEVYSKSFTDFMPWILDWEGRTFENDPNDPGGATKFGIDQRSHPNVDIRSLTEQEAISIYWKEWIGDGCDMLPSPYAEVFFNCAVNMGLGRAKEFDAASKGDAKTFLALQEAKYRSIAANNSNLSGFLKGWLNRTESLRQRFSI
jgi:lysozyme family protein